MSHEVCVNPFTAFSHYSLLNYEVQNMDNFQIFNKVRSPSLLGYVLHKIYMIICFVSKFSKLHTKN